MEIEVVRPKQYQDRIRDYHLVADGKRLSKIKPNSTQNISIPDGTEYIQAKVDWCSSPKFYLKDLNSDRIIIKNSLGGNTFKALFLTLYYITFGKGKYLIIENSI